jgi:hypothetical protein
MLGSGGACEFVCLHESERQSARSIEALLKASQDLKALDDGAVFCRAMVSGVAAPPVPPRPQQQRCARASYAKPKRRQRKNHDATSTRVLKQWLFQNLQRPYPSREERSKLALASFLTEDQVVHWFNNARKRMVQDISLALKDSSLFIESFSSSTNEDQDI